MSVVLPVWATPPIHCVAVEYCDRTCCGAQLAADPTAPPSGRWRKLSEQIMAEFTVEKTS